MSDVFRREYWTDDIFWPYLAGYIDRGGRIRLPADKLTVYVSLSGKDESILQAIREGSVNRGVARHTATASPEWVGRGVYN